MGFRVLGLSLLIFLYLLNFASSHGIQKTLPSEFVQKSKLEDRGIFGSKIAGGGAHGGGGARGGSGHGGGSHGGRSNGNGNSGTPRTGAGGAVIPIYAAGANKNRQPQGRHSAANCNLNKVKFTSMLLMTFVYTLTVHFLLI